MAHSKKGKQTPGAEHGFDPAALDALIGDASTTEDVETLFRQMKKALMERMLSGELTHHLGYAPGETKPPAQANHRNGTTPKTVLTEDGALPLAIPRDRAGTFEPQLVPKHVRRLPRFDQNVLSLYARGMTVREIQAHLEELYQVAVAPDVISTVTDAVLDEVTAWQQRPLEACYPVVIFDALRVKIRDEGTVRNKAVYLALGVRTTGEREILGLWIEQTEGAAFWRRSLAYVSWADRKTVAKALREIYRAPTIDAAADALSTFEASPWHAKYPTIAPIWRRHWDYVMPAFRYPLPVRRLLSTTNAIESVHMQLRKIIKTRGHFPTDEAAAKLLYLALRNITKKWRNVSREWLAALPHFVVLFGDRMLVEPR